MRLKIKINLRGIMVIFITKLKNNIYFAPILSTQKNLVPLIGQDLLL
jgi:hypothetical protein